MICKHKSTMLNVSNHRYVSQTIQLNSHCRVRYDNVKEKHLSHNNVSFDCNYTNCGRCTYFFSKIWMTSSIYKIFES